MRALVLGGRETDNLKWAAAVMLAGGALRASAGMAAGLPCPLRMLTGIPCPLCGMTTSVGLTMAGDLGAAAAANPFGVVAVAAAIALVALRPQRLRLPLGAVVAALGVSWIAQLFRFGLIGGP